MVYQTFSGPVYHRRVIPRPNGFKYNYDMVMIGCNSANPPSDLQHMLGELDKSDFSIKQTINQCKVYWLTEPGLFGMRFNPISYWYIVRDSKIVCILVTVSNTPWGESILYEIPKINTTKVWKKMHVSPFNPPSGQYYVFHTNQNVGDILCLDTKIHWNLKLYNADDSFVLEADMVLHSLNHHTYVVKNAIITILRIYWQALLLWVSRFPLYDHIKKDKL